MAIEYEVIRGTKAQALFHLSANARVVIDALQVNRGGTPRSFYFNTGRWCQWPLTLDIPEFYWYEDTLGGD